MRISSRLVAQYVDTQESNEDRVVLVDDETGAEHVFPVSDIPALARRISFVQDETADTEISRGDVAIRRSEFLGLAFALGYFWRSAQ